MANIQDAPPAGDWRRHPALLWASQVAFWGLLPFGTFSWGEDETTTNSAWTRRSL